MDPFKQYFYGTNIKVTVLSDTQVLKTAANGSKLLPKEEYKQALFMVANKGKDIFAPIIIADKEYIIQTRVDTQLASTKLYDFAEMYLEISGLVDEDEEDPVDFISDTIRNSILNPKSEDIDWDWLSGNDVKEAFSDPEFIDVLINYRQRAQTITNWPVDDLDIHDGNVGFLNNKLYIFDF